jgi:hypothetical protein
MSYSGFCWASTEATEISPVNNPMMILMLQVFKAVSPFSNRRFLTTPLMQLQRAEAIHRSVISHPQMLLAAGRLDPHHAS